MQHYSLAGAIWGHLLKNSFVLILWKDFIECTKATNRRLNTAVIFLVPRCVLLCSDEFQLNSASGY